MTHPRTALRAISWKPLLGGVCLVLFCAGMMFS